MRSHSGARETATPRPSPSDVAVAVGLLLLVLLVVAPGMVPSPRARALLALFAFVYPLGEVARRALFPRVSFDRLRDGLVAISLGSALLCAVAGAAWLGAGNRLSAGMPILAGALVALGAVAFARRGAWRRPRAIAAATASGREATAAPRPARTARATLVAAAALVAFLPLLRLVPYHDPLTAADDSLDHVGSLRKRVETDAVFPSSTFYATSRENGPDARKGLLHGALALVAASTRTPVLDLWDALPLAAAAWTLLAILAAGRALLPGSVAPIVAVALFAWGGSGGGWLPQLGYPSRLALAPYWTAWALLIDPARRAPLGLCALLGFGLAAIHTQAPLQIALFAAFLAIFARLSGDASLRRSAAPALRGAAALVVGAVPYLALRLAVSTPLVDTIHTEPQGLLIWSDRLFVINPIWLARSWGVVGLAAVPLALFAWRRGRSDLRFAFLASGLAGTVALLANPFLTPLLYRALGYLAIRLVWFTPHVFLVAWVATVAVSRLGHLARRAAPAAAPTRAGWAALAVALLAAGGALLVAPERLRAQRVADAPPGAGGFRAQRDAFAAVDRAIAAPSVILADPATGYAIPALTRHWTVSAMAQHTPPNDPDARDRLRDTRGVLSPYVDAAETVALLRHYGAEWVLVNASPQTRLSWYLYRPGAGATAATRAKLDARPDLFARVLDEGGLALYRLTDAARSGTVADPGFAPRAIAAGDAEARTAEAARPIGSDGALGGTRADAAYLFHGGEVLTAVAHRGESLRLRSVWERLEDRPEANRCLIVRLDRAGASEVADATPLAKLARVVSDRLRGERTRTRIGFTPGDGFLPPDAWPIGVAVLDVSDLSLPRDLAPGDYVVKIRIIEETFFPNLRPDDFLSMKDSYDGIPIGTVRVTEERETS